MSGSGVAVIALLMAVVHIEYAAVAFVVAIALLLCLAWPVTALVAWDSERCRRKASRLAARASMATTAAAGSPETPR